MLKEHARLSRQFAISVDAITVILAFVLSFYIRRLVLVSIPFGLPTSLSDYALLIIVIPMIWWALLNMQNAYTWQRFTSLWTEYQKVFKTTAWGTLIFVLMAFIFRIQNLPRSLIALFAVVCLIFLILEKTLLYFTIGQIRRRGHNLKRTLVVGTGKLARDFATTTANYPEWGLSVIGFLGKLAPGIEKKVRKPEGQEMGDPTRRLSGFPTVPPPAHSQGHVLGTYSDLIRVMHEQRVEEVVFALPARDLNVAREMLALCEQEGVQVRLVSDFFHTMIAKLHVHEIHGMPILTFSTAPVKEWQRFMKRGMDIVISTCALVALCPLFLVIAALIKLTSSGSVFYEWKVVGLNKRLFRGYKFRSMVKDADKLKEKLLEHNEMNGPVFKMEDDPRVTGVGRFLRKFSLDELPQLWSVLKGDMSLVGPRPCLQTELPHFENWQRRKFSVKPGITCLWQVNGRNNIKDFSEWAKMDLEYIDNWSLWLDFKVLFKTVPAVLLRRGAC